MGLRAYIERLGPIRDSEIEFRPFVIYTGESGLGKSYTAMLWYYFLKAISPSMLNDFLRNKIQAKIDIESGISLSIYVKDLRNYINQGVPKFLGYLLGNSAFSCSVVFYLDIDDDEIISLSIESSKDNHSVNTFHANDMSISIPSSGINDEKWGLSYILSRYLYNRIFSRSVLMPLIFPPARAAFIGGKQTTSSVGMYAEFNEQLTFFMRTNKSDFNDDQFFKSMVKKIVNGDIVTEENEVFIQFDDDTRIPISSAASSIKELAPLFFVLESTPFLEFYSVLFEEPEAHVHPLKQQIVADIVTRCVNKGMIFQITTHSDFFISRINQLLRLGNIKKANETVFEQYCADKGHNKNLYLNNDVMMGYYFKREEGGVKIHTLDISNGIPFKTFDMIIRQQMQISADIAEYGEIAGIETTV